MGIRAGPRRLWLLWPTRVARAEKGYLHAEAQLHLLPVHKGVSVCFYSSPLMSLQ